MKKLINNISLSKEEMIKANGKQFKTLINTKYANMLNKLRNILFEERKKYNSDI